MGKSRHPRKTKAGKPNDPSKKKGLASSVLNWKNDVFKHFREGLSEKSARTLQSLLMASIASVCALFGLVLKEKELDVISTPGPQVIVNVTIDQKSEQQVSVQRTAEGTEDFRIEFSGLLYEPSQPTKEEPRNWGGNSSYIPSPPESAASEAGGGGNSFRGNTGNYRSAGSASSHIYSTGNYYIGTVSNFYTPAPFKSGSVSTEGDSRNFSGLGYSGDERGTNSSGQFKSGLIKPSSAQAYAENSWGTDFKGYDDRAATGLGRVGIGDDSNHSLKTANNGNLKLLNYPSYTPSYAYYTPADKANSSGL